MRKKIKIKVEKEEEKVIEASCDFCKRKFNKNLVEAGGYGSVEFAFGYGSDFDGNVFHLDICDKCFVKLFANKLKKQMDEKGFPSETIKSILLKKN